MRFYAGAGDNGSPEFCKACQKKRGASTPCDDCPDPAILPENEQAVQVFVRLTTQFRQGRDGRFIGLDYPGSLAAIELMGVNKKDRPLLFEKIQIIEQEMVTVSREHGDKN